MGLTHDVRAVVPLALLVVGACTDGGRFSVAFEWDGAPPAAGAVNLIAEVIASERQVTRVGPVPYVPGAQLELTRVPNGEGLFVEVRAYPPGQEDRAPLYYGRSAAFELAPGVDVVVPVTLTLRSAPSIASVEILGAVGDRVRDPRLRLHVEAPFADRVEIAQDVAMSVGLRSYPEPPSELFYDLDETIGCERACDGTRRLFVRARRDGFASDPVDVNVVLDTTAPELLRAEVAYAPPDDSPLVRPTAAGAGTTVLLTAFVDELVRPPAEIEATDGTKTIALVENGGAGPKSTLLYSGMVTSADNDGVYVPSLRLEDLAGNVNLVSVASIDVKTSAPVLEVDQAAVSFVRSPFGADTEEVRGPFVRPAGVYFAIGPADPLSSELELPASAFMIAGGARPVQIRVWADADREALLGDATPTASGWDRADLRLANRDAARAYVTAIDRAGNESAAVPIATSWFVATPRSTPERASPHDFLQTTDVREGLVQTRLAGPADRAAASGRGDAIDVRVEGLAPWTQLDQAPLAGRAGHALVFDGGRGELVLFGGGVAGSNAAFGDTWRFDDHRWVPVVPPTSPLARSFSAMAYDPSRGRVVLFGGRAEGQDLADTWEWDGSTWHEVTPVGPSPSARAEHAMVFHEGRVLLFGGLTVVPPFLDFVRHDDLWAWDGTRWTELSPAGPGPSARNGAAMAFDPRSKRVLLFGGASSQPEDDLWSFDGTAWTLEDDGGGPPARFMPLMAYHAGADAIVVHGGAQPTVDDTWVWNGNAWQEVTSTARPPARRAAAMAYDPGDDRLVLFGGSTVGDDLADTWAWDGAAWLEIGGVSAAPPPRTAHGMAFLDGVPVVSGGGITPLDARDDVWALTAGDWNAIDFGAMPTPGPRWSHTFVERGASAVLFGGQSSTALALADTWVFDGTSWTMSSALGPAARHAASAAYDSSRGRVVVFGGLTAGQQPLQDTWTFDGADWLRFDATAPPPARSGAAAAYDVDRDRVVLFGGAGTTLHEDVWEWDGATWRDVTPPPSPDSPVGRVAHVLVYDRSRRKTVLLGGSNPEVFADEYLWDGTSWTRVDRAPTTLPSRRAGARAVYDDVHRRLLLFGGFLGATRFDDTWILPEPHAPAVQFDVRIPDDVTAAHGLRVRAACAGEGDAGAGATLLASSQGTVRGRRPGAWTEVASNEATDPADSAAWLDVTIDDTADVADFVSFAQRRVRLQCRPRGPPLRGPPASLRVDFFEVRVRY